MHTKRTIFRRVSCNQLIKRAHGQRSALTVPATATCAAAIIFALRLAIGAASLSCVHAGRDNRGRRLFLAGCAALVHAPIIPQLGNSAPPIINHIRAAPHKEQQRGAAPLFTGEAAPRHRRATTSLPPSAPTVTRRQPPQGWTRQARTRRH